MLTASGGVNVTGGTILGAGTLNGSVNVGGSGTTPTISAGDSGKAGLLAITGNYTQLSTATMNSFIGGATVGTQYSQLQVSGTASLAGTLTVTLASGFTPTIGSTFTVLTAGTVTGTFSNTTIAINGSEHFNVSYTSTGVVLTVASGAAPQSGGLAQADLAIAASTKRRPVLSSNLQPRIGGTPQGRNHILVAGIGRAQARSGAMLAGGYMLSRYESASALPVRIAGTLEHMSSGPERVIQSVPQSNNWNAPARGTTSLRLPLNSSVRRAPVKILPMFPRLAR